MNSFATLAVLTGLVYPLALTAVGRAALARHLLALRAIAERPMAEAEAEQA